MIREGHIAGECCCPIERVFCVDLPDSPLDSFFTSLSKTVLGNAIYSV